jgi:ribosome-binding ATPase YchF (GTP1/OBG family)
MIVEIQQIINTLAPVFIGVCLYFFRVVQGHEKRIQKVEDIFSIKIEHLIAEIEIMKKQIDHISKVVEKNVTTENNMSKAVDLLVKELKEKNERGI